MPTPRLLTLLGLGLAVGGVAGALAAAGEQPPVVNLPAVTVSAGVPLVKVADFAMREKRFAPAAVSDGRYIYIIGGQDDHGNLLRSIERFDPKTGESEEFAKLRTGRLYHGAVFHAGKIYVLGGSVEGITASPVQFNDPSRANPELAAEARMLSNDNGSTGALDLEGSMEVIDVATRVVSEGKSMPDPRNQFGCVTLGDELYVIGGRHDYHGTKSFANTVEIYSFAGKKWREGLPMPTPRAAPAVVVDGPFIVVPGGYNGTTDLDAMEAFDPGKNAWIILPQLCRDVSAHSLAFLGHYLFLFGNYTAPGELIAYDLKAKTSETFTLQYKPARHTACVVVDGKIYVVGGIISKDAHASDFIQVFALTPPGNGERKSPAR